MSPGFQSLFDLHVAPAYDKQLHLGKVVKGLEPVFQTTTGRMTFGPQISFQAQVLGYEDQASQTWKWSWAHAKSGAPDNLLQSARTLKSYGEKKGIPEFVTPESALGEVNGHMMAMVASGLLKASAYFREAYAGGAVYVLLKDPSFAPPQVSPGERILKLFPRVIFGFEMNHRRAFSAYLTHYGLEEQADGNVVTASDAQGPLLEAAFDEGGNLEYLRDLAPPPEPPPEAPRPSARARMRPSGRRPEPEGAPPSARRPLPRPSARRGAGEPAPEEAGEEEAPPPLPRRPLVRPLARWPVAGEPAPEEAGAEAPPPLPRRPLVRPSGRRPMAEEPAQEEEEAQPQAPAARRSPWRGPGPRPPVEEPAPEEEVLLDGEEAAPPRRPPPRPISRRQPLPDPAPEEGEEEIAGEERPVGRLPQAPGAPRRPMLRPPSRRQPGP
jgi:hypothetical protein